MTDSRAAAEWVVGQADTIHAVLADERFGVRPAEAGAPVGTVAWLRGSVSRFCNGPEHQRRRALVIGELDGLDPADLRAAAHDQALAALHSDDRPADDRPANDRHAAGTEEVAALARRVPTAVLAARLGAADPGRAATAVGAVAAAYFPGAAVEVERAADAATSELLGMLAGPAQDVIIARIAIMVQGYDATANLVGAALGLLAELDGGCPTDELLTRTAYRRPPVPALRRVAQAPAELGDLAVAAGDLVVCDVAAVSREADQDSTSQDSTGGRPAEDALTFGYGLRPCPGPAHALALAAGVIDAVRETATG
jgi:cytochrome P450